MNEVEKILVKRRHKKSGMLQYLVKWKGNPVSTWESESHLKNVPHLISAFNSLEANYKTKVKPPNSPGHSVLETHRTNDTKGGRTKPIQKSKIQKINPPILTKRLSHREQSQEKKEPPSPSFKKISGFNQQTDPIHYGRAKSNQKQKRDNEEQVQYAQISNPDDLSIPLDEGSNSDDEELFQQDPNFKILEMCRAGPHFLYLISDNGPARLVTHVQVLRQHTHALLDFYETHISFLPTQQQTKNHKKYPKSLMK